MILVKALVMVWGLWTIEVDPATQLRQSVFQYFFDQNDCQGESKAFASLYAGIKPPACVSMTEDEAIHEAELVRDLQTEIGIET